MMGNLFDRQTKMVLVIAGILVILILGLIIFSGLGPTKAGAKAAVEDEGYTHVLVSEPDFLNARLYCTKDEIWYFDVKAVNVNEKDIELYVCAGLLKGYTVRHH